MAKDLDFGLTFFYRVALPGALVAGAAYPLLGPYLQIAGAHAPEVAGWFGVAASAVIGVLLSALDDSIYQLYEGRQGWPALLAAWFTARWKSRVARLVRAADEAKRRGDRASYDELWSELREFPEDDNGDPTATAPTKMGNLLASYEGYPSRRYGMDSIFYWYRLWLRVDKDTREEVDRTWASTDALMYLAFGLAVTGVAYLITVLVSFAGSLVGTSALLPTSEYGRYGLGGVLLILLSYLPYRFSIPGHRYNGDLYKSLFDLYRSRLTADLRSASAAEREEWRRLWSALQYGVEPRDDHIREMPTELD